MEHEGFLRRWARLKGANAQEPPSVLTQKDAAATPAHAHASAGSATLPTLEEAMQLTPESDYAAFLAQGVDKEVRRLALKRLFADPHFNRLDGLDIYMGDYNRAEPLPAAMLAALRQAQGFLQDEHASAQADAASAGMEGEEAGSQGDPGIGASQMPANATRGRA